MDVFGLLGIAKRQTNDFCTQMINEHLNAAQDVTIGNENFLRDKYFVSQSILPPDCRCSLFSQFHDLCHPDWKITCKIILARFT